MTNPTGGAPQGNWQAPPPGGAPGGFNPNLQQVAAEPGPAPGVTYADLVTRIIASVIDYAILFVVNLILVAIGGAITLATGVWLFGFVFGIVFAAINAVYFVYGWTTMRASFGQKFLKLETVSSADGSTLTQQQAIRRWAFLFGPWAIGAIIPVVGGIIVLLSYVYALYLLYTCSQSAKRQGFHDLQAGTVVIKHA
jgi:uncharacterized RDD family membrane protein YckC